LHVYDHKLTFTKLATYSASVVKFNLGVYKSLYTPFRTPLHSRHHQQLENMSKAIEEDTVKLYMSETPRCFGEQTESNFDFQNE